MGLLQRIACEVNFNDNQSHMGSSYLPFIGFMLFLMGLVIVFIGVIKINHAKHQWNLFYDNRDRKDLSEPAYNREKIVGIVMVVVGVIMVVVSNFIL